MKNLKLSSSVFVFLCITCAIHAIYFYPSLPDQVAHHFDKSGKPDSWGSKREFIIIYFITIGIIAITFLSIRFFCSKLPNSLISLPDKDYWLSPERRVKTLDYIASSTLWLGSATLTLLLYVFHQSFQFNLGHVAKLDNVWIASLIYTILVSLWIVCIYIKFQRKKQV